MTNPNIVNVVNIYGNTTFLTVNTVTQNVVSNPIASSTLYKINSLLASNYSTNNYSITASVLTPSGSSYTIINNAVVPANSTLTILGKDNMIYLLENTAITMVSTSNVGLTAICSFEQIS